MSDPVISPALPRLHTAREVAEALGCSVWWVKERARRRLIPFTYVGGAYRFTAEHVVEIVRLHEEFPSRAPRRPAPRLSAPVSIAREPGAASSGPALTARPPRRLLKAQSQYDITA
ncbi:DNA-binding protein [Streptomyces solincola]|uniref:DNA-binding protein n=1 Tax=Streptomyces solincola TaxID=2100817 RepID=A0A2S9Q072_9ACTN|nr:DNA-binding protein [Streptomyces solincola]